MNTDVMQLADIGKTMARIRKSQTRKWTQEIVAKELGVERSVYSKYESGKVRPSEETVQYLRKGRDP